MTETKLTRRVAIRSLLVSSLAAGMAPLSGCLGGEESYPVIPSDKPKDELQKDIDNPFGAPIPKGKSKAKRRK
jgi:hypothetical protein